MKEIEKENGLIGLFVGQAADLTPNQVVLSSYVPSLLNEFLDGKTSSPVYWVADCLASIQERLKKDRGTIFGPRRMSAAEIQKLLNESSELVVRELRAAAVKILSKRTKVLQI